MQMVNLLLKQPMDDLEILASAALAHRGVLAADEDPGLSRRSFREKDLKVCTPVCTMPDT